MKWTKRKNGLTMATIRLRVHIPRPMVDFLTEYASMTQVEAVQWIREHVHEIQDDWSELGVEDDGSPRVISGDDATSFVDEDGGIVYEGPRLAFSK